MTFDPGVTGIAGTMPGIIVKLFIMANAPRGRKGRNEGRGGSEGGRGEVRK